MKTTIYKEINKYFNRVKVTTLERLKDKLNTNVDKTIQRYLKELEYLTSYTHKGKYYTLQRIPIFDTHGLWECKGIYFSRHGKLINTIEYFVNISEMGYCSEELQNRLHVNVNDALLNLVNNKRLHRKKIEKRYYYFSGTASIRKKQLLHRRSIEEPKFGKELLITNSINLELKRGFALFFNELNEKQKRIYTGLESARLGYGGDKIISATYGVDPHTVSNGRKEILSGGFVKESIRKVGGGRKLIKKKIPKIIDLLDDIMENDIAGDPVSGLKWTKKNPTKISKELAVNYQIDISHNTIRSILAELGYSLKINYKKIEYNKILTMEEKHLRNEQFLYIQKQKNFYQRNNYGVISVDAKKKEYIGNFKNNGKCWLRDYKIVNAYDFPSWAYGVGIPYGIYDILRKQGFVVIGTSYNTPGFAVSSVKQWWETIGYKYYGKSKKILILADGGGSNGWRTRFWKFGLQKEICNQYGVDVSVSHYPTGTSKYNPIEHLLFSQISNNWAGQPLLNYEVMINYISTTKTNTGLSVSALLDNNLYQKGIKITDKQMKSLNVNYHDTIPKWNYTISPQ